VTPQRVILATIVLAAIAGCGGTHRRAAGPSLRALLKRDFRQARQLVKTSPKVTTLRGAGYVISDGSYRFDFSWVPRLAAANRRDLAALEAYDPQTQREAHAKPYFVRVFKLSLAQLHDLANSLKRPRQIPRAQDIETMVRRSKLEIATLRGGARELGVTVSSLAIARLRVPVGGWTGYKLGSWSH
jgi:hypothetical protein